MRDECILKKSLLTKPKAIQNSILNLKSAFDSLCLDEKEQAINKSRHNFLVDNKSYQSYLKN